MFYVFQVSSSNASAFYIKISLLFTQAQLYRCNTFIRKGYHRFKILLRFEMFGIKSNENIVWACNLPKRWECPPIFGRKFLEIYGVRRETTPPKFVSPRFRIRENKRNFLTK